MFILQIVSKSLAPSRLSLAWIVGRVLAGLRARR